MNMFVGLCLCVSVYDRYHVFMGLIFWVWEIGTRGFFYIYIYIYIFFIFIKLPMCFCEVEKKEKEWGRRKKWSLEQVCEEERKKEKERRRKHEIQKSRWVDWVCEEEREKKKVQTWLLWPWVQQCVYLPKFHGNSISITQKHLKCFFNFHNSSLKNQRIKW